MISEKKKNWIEIEAFDKLHLMTITEYNEFGGSISSTSVASYGIDNSPKYWKSDIDARVKFYDEIRQLPTINVPLYIMDERLKSSIPFFGDWLLSFCFGNMNKDFLEKITKLRKKQ